MHCSTKPAKFPGLAASSPKPKARHRLSSTRVNASKVKAANILLKPTSAPAELLAQAREIAAGWSSAGLEFAPEEEPAAELARDYSSAQAPRPSKPAMPAALFEAPHYPLRGARGRCYVG